MKSGWSYLAAPLLVALAVALAYAALGDAVTRTVMTVENVIIFGAAGAGSVLALRCFGPGDYLRGVWGLMAACYGLLLLDTLLFGASALSQPREVSTLEAVVSGALTIAANVLTVVSLVWVSRAWRVAGLDLQVSRAAFWGSVSVVVVLALALLGRNLVRDVQEIAAGQLDVVHTFASSLGDVVAAALLVPLMLTALSLRGGSLAWPWGLLTASTVLWLGVDAIDVLATALGVSPATMLPVEEACRIGACLFQFTAGLAQRDALQAV